MNTLRIYRSVLSLPSQRWRWTLIVNGRKVANSGEGYRDRSECQEMALKVCTGKYSTLKVENG